LDAAVALCPPLEGAQGEVFPRKRDCLFTLSSGKSENKNPENPVNPVNYLNILCFHNLRKIEDNNFDRIYRMHRIVFAFPDERQKVSSLFE
jgi:hypothetical protein